LLEGEGWEMVGGNYGLLDDIQADPHGGIYFEDAKTGSHYNIQINHAISESVKTAASGSTGEPASFWVNHVKENNAAILFDAKTGTIKRYTAGATGTPDANKIFILDGEKHAVDQGLDLPYGLVFTPDRSQLYVTESNTHWVWIYNVNPDGTLSNKQRYGWLHSPDTTDSAQPHGIRVDRDGRVYVATNLGIQVLDQVGRVNAILPLPFGSGPATDLCFGGKDFNELYVICGNKLYRRKLNVHGMNGFDSPVKPAKPHL